MQRPHPPRSQGSKVDEIATYPTERIHYDITATPIGNVLGNLLGSGTKPTLWGEGEEKEEESRDIVM